jgi:predicted  nucleic acid-binding Zn-ribbon protein
LKVRLIVGMSLLLVCWFGVGCAPARDFDNRLEAIVEPYRFSIVKWEAEVIFDEADQWILTGNEKIGDEAPLVIQYFSLIERIEILKSEIEAINSGRGQGDMTSLEAELSRLQEQKAALQETVERIIERQVRETLAQQGIFNPIDEYIRLEVSFPPLNFKLDTPPYLLVISPRDKIESMREITLLPSLSLEEIEDIEARVDKLGVSSLVIELGGFGAIYPSLVANDASLRTTIDTATEEWLHQYLVFKPLGFLYLLDLTGVYRDYEIATMNETLASMVSKEIGSIIYQKYYSCYENDYIQGQGTGSGFDFNQEMREIRREVDEYLALGEIERTEEFMEQQRQYLASMGYYIRKLNQAYFAFYGTYADSPTSVSPIGVELKELREQSASLKDFLDTVAAMTSRQNLRDSLKLNLSCIPT